MKTITPRAAPPQARPHQIVVRNTAAGLDAELLDLAPELVELARPIVAKWETAILRVAASHADPQRFPMPQAESPETVLARRFHRLPAARTTRAGQRAVETLNSPRFRKRVGPFVNLEALESPRDVQDLLKPVHPPVSNKRLAQIARLRHEAMGIPHVEKTEALDRRKLTLQLIRLVCVDETNGFLGSERGQDEIELGGVALDETADIGKIKPFKVGNFDDGTRVELARKPVFTFDLTEGTTYPKSYFVTFVMVEADFGNFSETMDAIIKKLAAEAAEKLTVLIAGSVGAAAGGPLGALIGVIVGYIVGKVVKAIISAWEDDAFEVRTIEAIVPSANARLTEPSNVVRFGGPGEYALRYAWALSSNQSRIG